MIKGVLVYLSGPIGSRNGFSIEQNVASGLKVLCELTNLGIPAFSPQIIADFPSAHQIAYEKWMEYDFRVIDRCTHMLMIDRWESSPGALREADYAQGIGMPIFKTVQELADLLLNEE